MDNLVYSYDDPSSRPPSIIGYTADIQSSQDYNPFGMIQQGRSFISNTYRYGFNRQEKDDEITSVTSTHLSFECRIYDSRIGRFLSVEPIAFFYPWNST